MVMQRGRTWRRVCSENSDLACCSDAVCREAHATLCRSKPWGPFHADVPQGDLTLEHKIDRMATVRVPRCPLAGRKVHHELYHLGLQGSIRDAEPRLGDNPAPSPWIAGIETVWPRTAIAGVAAIRVAMVRTRRLAELRLFGTKHPLFVQRAITIVVQALSSLGSSRLVAICTSSLRSPPRTTGQ